MCNNFAYPSHALFQLLSVARIAHREDISAMGTTNIVNPARKDVFRLVDKSNMVANLLHRRHIVRGEDHRGTLIAQAKNLLFECVGIYRVEAGEWLVENKQLGAMQYRNHKLNLLRHTLRQILDLLVPPALDAETGEPLLQTHQSLMVRQPLQLGKEEGLLAHLHFAVQTTLLGEIADAKDILLRYWLAVEENTAFVGQCDTVNCADKCGFACAVWAEQTIDRATRYLDRNIIEGGVCRKSFGNVFGGNNVAHTPKNF